MATNKRIQERQAKRGRKVYNGKGKPKAGQLIAFKVQMVCGCCDDTVHFRSEKAIEAAFAKAGLTSSANIKDDTGYTAEGVDTFYGWRKIGEERRGLEFLIEQVKSKI